MAMRDYGRIACAFWQDKKVRGLPEDGRTMLLYLLTCPHANLIGCFRLPDAYAADDLQWEPSRVRTALAILASYGMVVRDDDNWLVIQNYVKWNRFENGNVARAAEKAFDQVPAGEIQAACAKAVQEFGTFVSEGFAQKLETVLERYSNRSDTVLKTVPRNPSHIPDPEPIQNQSLPGTRTRTKVAPTLPGSDAPPKSGQAWEAYAGAYRERYGVDPVRNQRSNILLCQLVDRLGAGEAPDVAAFYLRHQKSVYVAGRHSVELLVRDAEAIRTDWATGRQSTVAAAVLGDKTQTTFNVFDKLKAEARASEGTING